MLSPSACGCKSIALGQDMHFGFRTGSRHTPSHLGWGSVLCDQVAEAIGAILAQHGLQAQPYLVAADNLGAKGWSLPA